MGARSAVFFDRDGVLNETPSGDHSPRSLVEVRVASDAPGVVRRFREAGFVTVIVTNQPDVARGEVTVDAATEVNDAIRVTTGADATYMCIHSGDDGCACRKPLPGLLLDAARDHAIALSASWLIGDRWVDIQAADAAGVRSVLLERPYSWAPTSAGAPRPGLQPTHRATSLVECADVILADATK